MTVQPHKRSSTTMKTITLLFVSIVVASGFAAPADLARFEKQLRSDLHAILQTRWSAQKASKDADAYADKWLHELKSAYPDLLPTETEPAVPTDLQLAMLQDEAAQLRVPKPRGEIWFFYQNNWRRRLSVDQRILFGRFLGIVIAEARKQTESDAEIQRLDPEIQRLEEELHRLRTQQK
jgi:hypothetical protein